MNYKNKSDYEKALAERMRHWLKEVHQSMPEHRAWPRRNYMRLFTDHPDVAAKYKFSPKLVR